MGWIEAVGYTAAVFTTIAVIPQIRKVWIVKKVADISIGMFIVLLTGVALWTLYGILTDDWPIIVCNGISTLLNGIMLVMIIKHRVPKHQNDSM